MSASTVAVVAASAAIANAMKASGIVVHVVPEEFTKILGRADEPLVAYSPARGWIAKRHTYLMSHRGLAFYTSSRQPLDLGRAQVVLTKSIWAPT
jgi:hypothetical protein